MPNVRSVSFNTPGGYEYLAEQEAIEERRRLAESLRTQGQSPFPGTETVGGWAIRRSPWEGVAKVVQSGAGAYHADQAKQEQRELSEKVKNDYTAMLSKGLRELQGTPGGLTPEDAAGNVTRQDPIAPNPAAALGTFASHPGGQQLVPLAMQEMSRQRLAQALRGGSPQVGGQPQAGVPQGQPGGAPGAPPQAAGIQPGGPAGGIPMEAWLQVDPSGKSYMEQLAKDHMEARKPIVGREGAPVLERGPDGRLRPTFYAPKTEPMTQLQFGTDGNITGVAPIPGAAGTVGTLRGAEEDAKAARDMVTVQTPQGPRMMTRTQAVQMAGGGQPQAPQMPPQNAPGPAQQLPFQPGQPGIQPGMDFNIGGVKGTLPTGDDAVRLARQMGHPMNGPLPAPAGITLQDESTKTYNTERAKGYVKLAEQARTAWGEANNKNTVLDRLEMLYNQPGVAKGALAEQISGLKNIAASFGIDIKGVGAEQAIESISNELTLQLKNKGGETLMPGAMSDPDRQFLKAMAPSLAKTPEGRRYIMETFRKVNEREIQIANMAIEYELEHGKLDTNFEKQVRKFAKENPIFGKKQEKPTLSTTTLEFLKQNNLELPQ